MMNARYLGRFGYDEALRLQRELWQQRVNGEIGDQLLLLEHPPVITLGRNSQEKNLLASAERLRELGVEVREADRGGDVTYHGPGQLVGYPIIDLKPDRMDVLRYLRDLEEVLIQVLEYFGIYGQRREDYTGVWVGERKIAAIGVKISRWVTYHGFALNVCTDLPAFDLIVPCGILGVSVTSMQKELGFAQALEDVAHVVADRMNAVFDRQSLNVSAR